ncbi:bacteriohemerythrin [Roseovarius sp. S4756]|uniref:bacteriohemerythrin n=1 Tax=Roseovarius maritimus TaxID=3342637 RepID=UPI0037278642
MKWQARFETGDTAIDQQHKLLFDTTNQYRQVLEANAGEATYDLFLEALTLFVETHFSYEEECMFAHLCPAAGQNKREHEHFSRLVLIENERFASEGFVRTKAERLLGMIDNWLESHIGRIDIQLKDYLPKA